jgi:hypothetical protein
MLEASARLTGLLCGTQPMNDIWSPRATLQSMLDVEAALARASATHKVIPQSAVAAIEAACHADQLDAEGLARDAALGGNLAIPLVKRARTSSIPRPSCNCATPSTCSILICNRLARRSPRLRAGIAPRR